MSVCPSHFRQSVSKSCFWDRKYPPYISISLPPSRPSSLPPSLSLPLSLSPFPANSAFLPTHLLTYVQLLSFLSFILIVFSYCGFHLTDCVLLLLLLAIITPFSIWLGTGEKKLDINWDEQIRELVLLSHKVRSGVTTNIILTNRKAQSLPTGKNWKYKMSPTFWKSPYILKISLHYPLIFQDLLVVCDWWLSDHHW